MYLYIRVHTRLYHVQTCIYFQMYVPCMYHIQTCLYISRNVQTCMYKSGNVLHVCTMYVTCLYYSIVHSTRLNHVQTRLYLNIPGVKDSRWWHSGCVNPISKFQVPFDTHWPPGRALLRRPR